MEIREASRSDALIIADIHAKSWKNTYQYVLTKKYLLDTVPEERHAIWVERLENPKHNQHVLIASLGDEIVGFVCIYADENSQWGSYLDNLHVLKRYQSKGIGKALLIQSVRWCLQQYPTKGMCLLVNQDNTYAQEFYKKLGAFNAQKSTWNAPDGSIVPTYWFVWNNLSNLVENDK